MRLPLAFALLLALPAWGSECRAISGPRTAVLVELYTSEGCSSCPPAERWLSEVGRSYPPDQVVPLALHVDYWDYLGWKDPYARREFSQRQRRLSQQQRLALVYTPQVLLQGADFRGWGSSDFRRAVERIHARPAAVRLAVEIVEASAEALRARVRAELLDPAQRAEAALYVAAYENRLQSRVSAGENAGRVLSHDHVVLEWRGPLAPGVHELSLPLLPRAKLADSGIVAFVQERRSTEVLQALLLPTCPARRS